MKTYLFFIQAAIDAFQELDARINNVATKVVYLGDQLENVNTPRSRAVEAQKLLTLFSGFLKVPTNPYSSPAINQQHAENSIGTRAQFYRLLDTFPSGT